MLRGDTRVKCRQTFASEMTTAETQKNNRAGKTCTCGCSVSERQAISDLCCDGAYQTQKHTQKLDRIFWSPHRQVLI